MDTVSLPLTAQILFAPSGGSIVPCMPDLKLEANVETRIRETTTPKKFFITDVFNYKVITVVISK
jgi:hypothetical protein